MTVVIEQGELSVGDLDKVVRSGREVDGVGKTRALAVLPQAGGEQAAAILRRVAGDRKEAASFRHQAILGLYRVAGRGARDALLKIARSAEGEAAADLAMVLGRIGELRDRDVLARLVELA